MVNAFMCRLSVALILGTRRIGRKSSGVAHWVLAQFAYFPRATVHLLDLADFSLPSLEQRDDQAETYPKDARRFREGVANVDAVVIVTPEYKNSYPGALKNALDYLPPDGFRRKPVGIITVSSGQLGGVNCLSQLRLVCLALGGLPIPNHLLVSNVQDVFDDEGRCLCDEFFQHRAREFLLEVLWYAEACKLQTARASEPE